MAEEASADEDEGTSEGDAEVAEAWDECYGEEMDGCYQIEANEVGDKRQRTGDGQYRNVPIQGLP